MLSLAFESILKKYCDSFRFSPLFSVYFFGKGSDTGYKRYRLFLIL